MSNINLLLANASGSLDSLIDTIQSSFEKSKQQVISDLDLDGVDVVCLDLPHMTILELGVGGYTPNENLVYLYIDSSKRVKKKDIFATLIHELHHAKRWQAPGYGSKLYHALITEGMACHYEEEVTENKPIYANRDYDVEELLKSLDLNEENYNHQTIFFTGDEHLPRWFGYAAGYWLVAELKRIGKIENAAKSVQDEFSIEDINSLIEEY